MVKFRFQDLKIWQLAIKIANELLKDLDVLCRQITNFQKSLKKSYT
jgi:hypothetical protein